MRFIKFAIPVLFLAIYSHANAQTDEAESQAELIQKEIQESLNNIEQELDKAYAEFDREHAAEIKRKFEEAIAKSKEHYSEWQDEFAEIYSNEKMAELEARLKKSATEMEQYFKGFQNNFNQYGFNEFYYSKEPAQVKEVLTRTDVDGKISYQKIVNGRPTGISSKEIEELEAVFNNGGKATGKESGEIISIDSNNSTHTEDGKLFKSNTVKIVKQASGC